MSAVADFLVEIGTEELPPRSLRDLERSFAAGIAAGLAAAGLECSSLQSYATPRRIAVLVTGLPICQPVQRIEKRGPPVSVAFGPDGKPTRAAQAFADGLGVAVADLGRVETEKGAWLIYRAEAPGQETATVLAPIVETALADLPIPRRMRWGDGDTAFVRPVHWVVMLFGDRTVPATILGLRTGRLTRGHRFHAPGPVEVAAPADYAATLERARVLPVLDARRERVRQLAEEAARSAGGRAQVEPDLLDEVTALVEWPVPVVGRFDAAFLRLPTEVLVATLQGHQRYFPVVDAGDRLLPLFVAMANIDSLDPEEVRRGNERVILPRLTDAAFFWEQDSRIPLQERVEELRGVVYQKGLGSMYERSVRVAGMASGLAPALGASPEVVHRAALLAKTDLLTLMVREFPELQGHMGCHYARRNGEPEEIARALEEQYLPRHAGDRLPATPAGRALAIADRLDTLAGVFALGKRPSGNRDPYGLRRAALGLLRIIVEGGVELDLPAAFGTAVRAQPLTTADPAALAGELFDFVTERSRAWYLEGHAPGLPAGTVTPGMFEAVRVRRPGSPLDFHARLVGVQAFMGQDEAESLAIANKRIANILRAAGGEDPGDVDASAFEFPEEAALQTAIDRLSGSYRHYLTIRDYRNALLGLSALKAPVDAFFDAVLVMSPEPARRRTRLAQLRHLRGMFLEVADLSCIPSLSA